MSRSLKKAPYVCERLLKRINELNQTGEKKVLQTWSRPSPYIPKWWGTPSLCMTAESMFPFISQRIWLAISWVNLRRPERSEGMRAQRPASKICAAHADDRGLLKQQSC